MRPLRLNNSGIILFVVLWTLVILTILAVSLGRSTNIELMLTKNAIGKLQSKYLAWAGVSFALDQLALDSASEDDSVKDDRYHCGISGKIDEINNIFKKHELGGGYFSVQFTEVAGDGKKQIHYGMEDEERKLNINALNIQTYPVLKYLLSSLGYDEALAEEIAFNVVDWVDPDNVSGKDSQVTEDELGADSEKSYLFKNLPFDSLEELLLVPKVTDEIYLKLKDYVTIFPKNDGLKINFDTAAKPVLSALAKSYSGGVTNTDTSDAESFVDKMMKYRAGEDAIEATADDRTIEPNDMGLNAKEQILWAAINPYRTLKSMYFHIKSQGAIPGRSITTTIDAVVRRDDFSIISWRRY